MHSYVRRAHRAAIFPVCAALAAAFTIVLACNSSSPVENDPIAAAADDSPFEAGPVQLDLGTDRNSATLVLENNTEQKLSWRASEDSGWLVLESDSGRIASGSSKQLSISVRRAGLAAGSYTTDLTVRGENRSGTEVITVSMAVESGETSGQLSVSPLKVDFGSTTTSLSVTLRNNGGTSLSWQGSEDVGWLALGATSGSIPANSTKSVVLKVDRSRKAAGSYWTNVKFSTGGGEIVKTQVAITVPSTSTSSTATFSASPLKVDFGSTSTSASVKLTNSGNTSISWTASEGVGWLALGSTSGTIAANSSKTLGLNVNRTGKSAGTYSTDVSFAAGTGAAAKIPVSMTVPSTSPPPTSVSLAGQLVDQFDGHVLSGLTVQYNGVSVQTNSSGQFTIPGSPISSLKQLTISGGGVHKRITYAKTGDTRWEVVPASFSMSAFNDVARDEFGPATVRWVQRPTVYIDTRPEGFTSSELSTWISQVKVQAAEFISKWSGSEISPSSVIVTSNPPSDYSQGAIVIHFSENAADYGGSEAIGMAAMWSQSNGAIGGATIWLRYKRYSGSSGASKRRGILGHELGHSMGLGHMEGSTISMMEPSIGSTTDLYAFDHRVAAIHYSRSPRNTSLDTDNSSSVLGSLSPLGSVSPSGTPSLKRWICDAGVETASGR